MHDSFLSLGVDGSYTDSKGDTGEAGGKVDVGGYSLLYAASLTFAATGRFSALAVP